MRRLVFAMLAGLLTAAIHHPVAAQTAPTAAAIEVPAGDAMAILDRMADMLADATSFSLTLTATYDVVEDGGEKIEFGEVRHIVLSRPNGLRIDLERRDGSRQQIRFDGKTLTMFTPGKPYFATLDRPGSVDDILYYLVQGLQTPVPLSLLLVTAMPQEVDGRIKEIDLVDNEILDGKEVDHVAGRTDDIDFQFWIARGDLPVPLRVVISYKKAPGEPQFAANLSDWNFAPQIDQSAFAFVPPAGARSVPFMVPAANKPTKP
jgi:hypothetical protein